MIINVSMGRKKSPAERQYVLHSAFLTIQGEGANAGHASVFLRFSGCNVWSGREKDRERDMTKGACAAFCDTEFGKPDPNQLGGRYTASEMCDLVGRLWKGPRNEPFVTFTGGEPGLQLDGYLVDEFKERFRNCHLECETNGSLPLPDNLDWVTLSPKPPMPVHQSFLDAPGFAYHALKVVYPAFHPEDIRESVNADENVQLYVQPQDHPEDALKNTAYAVDYVKQHPHWKLSTQTHKFLGID